MRCMIIDDNQDHLDISCTLVKKLGYSEMGYSSAKEALKVCERILPDVVLLDWEMPEMDGPEFIVEIKKIQDKHTHIKEDIPIIMCTGVCDKKRIMEMLNAGIKGYIVKPFTQKDLVEKLKIIKPV